MGQEVIAALCREPDMEPVGAICRRHRGDGLDLPDGSGSIPLSTDLEAVLRATSPEVLVDFTNAEATLAAAPVAARHGVNMVIGSTGLNEDHLQSLDRLTREQSIGVTVAPNFALGAVLIMHLAKRAAPFFEYADIIEMHHEAKIDAPSAQHSPWPRAISQDKEFQRNQPEREPLAGTRGESIMASASTAFAWRGEWPTTRSSLERRDRPFPCATTPWAETATCRG